VRHDLVQAGGATQASMGRQKTIALQAAATRFTVRCESEVEAHNTAKTN
jgi:hypothetical protein